MKLSDVFESIAYKTLAPVDIPGLVSHQHEINGVSALREFFNVDTRIEEPVSWIYYSDSSERLSDEGSLTFYDARANHPTRTEWRLYYSGEFLSAADPGDLLILARRRSDRRLFALVFQKDSSFYNAIKSLFDIRDDVVTNRLVSIPHHELSQRELSVVDRLIVEDSEIETFVADYTPSEEQLVLEEFGIQLPPTRDFSEFARNNCEVDILDPDDALVTWIDKETRFFNIIMKHQIERRIEEGFGSADDFIDYAVSLTNRRRSRMGLSLENQIEALLVARNINFDRNQVTEGKSKPDFIFPSIDDYRNRDFPASYLTMLGAKSTCKDRWRQVLKEAVRIEHKHLCTLERGISVDQTEEMRRENLALVVPEPFQITYNDQQIDDILSLSEFFENVEYKQKISY